MVPLRLRSPRRADRAGFTAAPSPQWLADIAERLEAVQAMLTTTDMRQLEFGRQLTQILEREQEILMTDASVAAVAADIETQVQALTAATASASAAIQAILADVTAGTANVSPTTLAALQQAQADLDSAVTADTAASAADTADVPPATPPAS